MEWLIVLSLFISCLNLFFFFKRFLKNPFDQELESFRKETRTLMVEFNRITARDLSLLDERIETINRDVRTAQKIESKLQDLFEQAQKKQLLNTTDLSLPSYIKHNIKENSDTIELSSSTMISQENKDILDFVIPNEEIQSSKNTPLQDLEQVPTINPKISSSALLEESLPLQNEEKRSSFKDSIKEETANSLSKFSERLEQIKKIPVEKIKFEIPSFNQSLESFDINHPKVLETSKKSIQESIELSQQPSTNFLQKTDTKKDTLLSEDLGIIKKYTKEIKAMEEISQISIDNTKEILTEELEIKEQPEKAQKKLSRKKVKLDFAYEEDFDFDNIPVSEEKVSLLPPKSKISHTPLFEGFPVDRIKKHHTKTIPTHKRQEQLLQHINENKTKEELLELGFNKNEINLAFLCLKQ